MLPSTAYRCIPSLLLLTCTVYAQNQAAAITINPGPSVAAAATSSAPGAANTSAGTGVIGQGSAAGGVPVWVVKVSDPNNKLVFSPNTVQAKVGDMVQFQFYARNHSVVSSTFEQPCVPNGQPGAAVATNAFFSGFMPTDQMGQLTYTVPVRDTNPMWFYCSQGMHCQAGMVGVINPPATGQTLADYTARAAQAPQNLSPGGATAATPQPPQQPGQIGGTTAGAQPAATPTKNSSPGMGVWKQGTLGLGLLAMVIAVCL